jgi:hypothetical protein
MLVPSISTNIIAETNILFIGFSFSLVKLLNYWINMKFQSGQFSRLLLLLPQTILLVCFVHNGKSPEGFSGDFGYAAEIKD